MEKENKNERMIVEEEIQLLNFLLLKIKSSRNNIKSLLKYKKILVNNTMVTRHDHNLKVGDEVVISKTKFNKKESDLESSIIYEDDEFIVIDKKEGLLSVSTIKEKKETAFHLITDYVKNKNINNRIFIVHRLDKDTSGVLLLAKNEKVKLLLQDNWSELVTLRKYYALVEGNLNKKEDTIISWLNQSKTQQVYSSNIEGNGQKAITYYKVIDETREFSLLEVVIHTGRKNQIRVHLSDIGHPVVGDKKYGSTFNPINRLGLHASVLEFKHPFSSELKSFKAQIPPAFLNMFDKK